MKPESHKPPYRREGDHWLLELHLRDARQLFNSLDPAPFHEKDLDDDAVRYLVESARDLPRQAFLRLVLWLPPEQLQAEAALAVPDAVHHFFAYEADLAQKEVRHLLHMGRIAFLIGLAFLLACEMLRGGLPPGSPGTPLQALNEGLSIIGWVAMWRPLQIFLYDWWPIVQRRRLLQRLAGGDIVLRARPA